MKIFLAGATGALGRQLLPRLVERGHEVTGMTRSESKQQLVRDLGGRPVVGDALDPESVAQAVAAAEPEAIVHQLTAIPHARSTCATSRVTSPRPTGCGPRAPTTCWPPAAPWARAASWPRATHRPSSPARGAVKAEDDPLDESPPDQMRATVEAIRHLESAVTAASWTEGVVLRYGAFYGPGTNFSLGPEGTMVEAIRKRQLPLVGRAGGVWSFIHIEDAAEATVNAIEGRGRGIYNVVDDEPAAVAEWLPAVAKAAGAPAPCRVPRWLGRLFAGESATVMMTEARGASNAKAKRELAWTPRHASWREGFATGLG